MARSAGSFAQLVAKEGGRLNSDCLQVRFDWSRLIAWRLSVRWEMPSTRTSRSAKRAEALDGQASDSRGVAMNPVDHPHGGGEGKTSGGRNPGDAVGPADTRLQDAQQQAH